MAPSSFVAALLAAALGVGCSASSIPGPAQGRPFDATQALIHYPDGTDRLLGEMGPAAGATELLGAAVAGHHPHKKRVGDWSYLVGGNGVNGGPAVWVTSATGVQGCTDSLYVPVNGAGANNLYAFTQLYSSCANTTGDANCSPSPTGHCPKVAWRASLTGAMNRDSVTLDLTGTTVYVATDAGRLYAVKAATGAIVWSLNAQSETGGTSATGVQEVG